MKTLFAIVLVLVSHAAFAQSPVQTFQLSYQPTALPGGKSALAANDAGFTFGVTQNGSLQSDNLVSMDGSLQAYFGGYKYRLNFLSNQLQKLSPQLNGNSFAFSVHAGAGVDRYASAQHYAAIADFSADYDPTASGKFSVNLLRIGATRLPGFAKGWDPIVSAGIKFWP